MNGKTTKKMDIWCNEKFLRTRGGLSCTMLGDFIFSILPHPFDNVALGSAIKTCLENSKELSGDEWCEEFGWGKNYVEKLHAFEKYMAQKVEEHDAEMIREYGFKDEKALYRNMMSCSIDVYDDYEISIENSLKTQIFVWDNDEVRPFNVKIHYNSPAEIVGAVARYTIARCRGKGSYAKGVEKVSKILFPETSFPGGVPASLEEYLSSLNLDYEQWLIPNYDMNEN